MASWYVKEFSKLTNITVRTLHHYDRIDLLKPSKRLGNGYRVYTEFDLLKVQPIVVLRFFGFSLTTIKEIISTGIITSVNLLSQKKVIKDEIVHLESAYAILEKMTDELKNTKSIDLYKMLQFTEQYSVEESKNELFFRTFKSVKFKEAHEDPLDDSWDRLINEIKASLHQDPRSFQAVRLAKAWLALTEQEKPPAKIEEKVLLWINSAIDKIK